jgi:hypothetical protein
MSIDIGGFFNWSEILWIVACHDGRTGSEITLCKRCTRWNDISCCDVIDAPLGTYLSESPNLQIFISSHHEVLSYQVSWWCEFIFMDNFVACHDGRTGSEITLCKRCTRWNDISCCDVLIFRCCFTILFLRVYNDKNCTVISGFFNFITIIFY